MSRRGVIAVLSICAVAATSSAAERKRDVDALRTLDQFGRCVGSKTVPAMRLLTVEPRSPDELSVALALSSSECLGQGELRFQPQLLRGVVAEALIRKSTRSKLPARASVFTMPDASSLEEREADQRAVFAMIGFGQCVAANSGTTVEKLLATPRESSAEREAMGALGPSLNDCAQQGMTFRLDRFQMRNFPAEGAYRNLVQARGHASND